MWPRWKEFMLKQNPHASDSDTANSPGLTVLLFYTSLHTKTYRVSVFYKWEWPGQSHVINMKKIAADTNIMASTFAKTHINVSLEVSNMHGNAYQIDL